MIRKNGFTFIEVIVTVSIISILAAVTIVSMKSLQMNGRDARRVSDINEIRNALNIYFSKYNQYPSAITPGERFKIGNIIYLERVPTNPSPNTDGNCANGNYTYATQNNNTSYTLNFCLGGNFSGLQAGNNQATPEGITAYVSVGAPGSVTIDIGGNHNWTSELPDQNDTNSYTNFSIVLDTQPTNDVTINIATSDGGSEATVNPSSVIFTTSDWNTPRIITVNGVNDNTMEDNPTSYNITFTSSSSDTNYNNLSINPLALKNYDECGRDGSGTPGAENGQCLASAFPKTCVMQAACPHNYYCSVGLEDPGLCGSGEGCWRNSDCSSNDCVGANVPDTSGTCN